MRAGRASRFLGVAAAPGALCRRLEEEPALPFRDATVGFILHCERPVLRIGDLSVAVLGAICEAEEGGSLTEPERLVAGLSTRYGKKFASRLDGWFLVVIRDHKRRELLVVNNPYTSGTCYYCPDGEGLIIADSLSRVLSQLGSRPKLDKGSLINYLNNGYNHTEHTCFDGVRKLLPGCLLCFHDGRVEIKRERAGLGGLPGEVFEVTPLLCPRCAATMAPVAVMMNDGEPVRLLSHLGLPTDFPDTRPARSRPPDDGCQLGRAYPSCERGAGLGIISWNPDGPGHDPSGPPRGIPPRRYERPRRTRHEQAC